MSEVTKYRNELNTIPMRKWTREEQNFFFAIITEARDEGSKMLTFNKDDLVELANYSLSENKRLEATLTNLIDKLDNMKYRERTSNSYTSMALFQYFHAEWTDDLSDFSLKVQVSSHFAYIINKLEAEFTQFELKQFTNIRSTYAKEMFKKLKQWRTVGVKEYSIDEFRDMLQIPPSYQASDITKVVLTPIENELSEYFEGLKIKPIKANTRGNPIIAYRFTFKPEPTGQWEKNKYKKRSKKKETLPTWATDEIKDDKVLSNDVQKEFQKKLNRIRK